MDDIEAIRQLTARYNRASDEGDVETWIDCFLPGAVFRRSNATAAYAGHDQLRVLLAETDVAARHVTTDYEISVEDDHATQVCYLMFLNRRTAFTVHMFGTYHDRLVKREGRWYFGERFLAVDEGPGAA